MNFNLLPWRESAQAKQKRKLLIELILCLILTLIVIEAIKISYSQMIKQKNLTIIKLQQQIEKLTPDYLTYTAIIEKNKNNDIQIQVISGAMAQYEMIVNLLEKIGLGMPEQTHLTQLQINDTRLQLGGESDSHTHIATLLKYLEQLTNKATPINSETNYDDNNAIILFHIAYSIPFI